MNATRPILSATPTPDPTPAPVVVGVDGSPSSEAALRWAAAEAMRRGRPLRIVSVWTIPAAATTTPLMSGVFVDPAPFEEQAERSAIAARTLVRIELGADAPEVEVVVVEGFAIDRLVEQSAHGEMLVVGSRGRGGFASLVLGSVADGCVHHSAVPVVVVRPEGSPVAARDVVVGLDDTEGSMAALRWAAVEAGRLGLRLVVIHARGVHHALYPDLEEEFGDLPDVLEATFAANGRRFVDRLLGGMAGTVGKPSSVSWRIVDEAAPKALLDAAASAALLVVGAHDHGRVTGRLLGSVSRQCVHHSPCPVVVVPTAPATVATGESRLLHAS
ncbi:MAG: universal stress protein [Acidimicrobiales bacterium]